MANQQYDLRVGINFDPAKRDVRDFAAFSAQQQQTLAQNVAAATRQALAGAAGGSRAGQQQAGALLANIKTQIPQIARELEAMFRRVGKELRIDPKAFTKEIDALMRPGRRGFNRATVGGLPIFDPQGMADPRNPGNRLIVPRDLNLGSIRQGYNDQISKNEMALQAQATDMLQASIQARRELLGDLQTEAAQERATLGAMLTDRGTTRAIASQRVAIATLLTQQREIEARATTAAQFAQQSELTVAREKVITAAQELSLTQSSPTLIADIATQRARLADILRRQATIESEALAAANLRLGFTARASNLGNAALTTVPAGAGTNLRNNPTALASLNQSIARSFTATAVAAQKTTVAQNTTLTRFQRAYQSLHARNTGGGPPTLGQFVGSRALSTAAFGLTGGLLYGGISFMRELITEAQELQVQFGITQSVFEEFGGTINGVNFDQYKQQIIDISRETGVSAEEIARVSRELAGAFADVEGAQVTPNVEVGNQIATLAVQLSKIAGLPLKEASDSFSASVIAFTEDGDDATEIATRLGDAVVGLEAKFGVSTAEMLNFTASLAPMASEMGFTIEQLTAFGAVVEQALGSDVAASENISRIFATLSEKIGPLAELLQRGGLDPNELVRAIGQSDMPEALRQIVGAYDDIGNNPGLKNQIGQLVGGARQARTFFAVLDRGDQILAALDSKEGDFTGSQQERWDKYRDTVVATFERMQRAVEEFGLALFDAGLVDALVALADAGEGLADVARLLLSLFSKLNDLMGGFPAKLLVAAAAFKVLGLAGGFLGGRGAGAAGGLSFAARASTFFNPQVLGGVSPLAAPQGVQGYGYGGVPLAPGAFVNKSRIGQYDPNVNSRFGVRGLAAGEAGKVGQAFAGIVGTLAPLAAGIAITALISEVTSTVQAGNDARKSLRELTAQKIKEGVSPQEIRDSVAGLKSQENDFGSDINNAITSGFGLLGDSKNPYAVGIDEAQKAEKSGLDQQLQAILDSKNDLNQDQVDLIKAFMKSEGTTDRTLEAINRIISEARKDNPELANAFDTILAAEEAKRKAAEKAHADIVNQPGLAASVAELEALYQSGKIPAEQLAEAYEKDAALNRRLYDNLKDSNPEAALASLQKSLQDQQNLAKLIEQEFGRREEILSSLTGDDPTALIDLKKEQFNQTEDPQKRVELALEIRKLQQQILEEEADMADTAEEELAILRGGFTPDSSAVVLVIEQVKHLDPEWRAFLTTTFGSVQAAGSLIEEAAMIAVSKGISFAAALVDSIRARVARAKAAYDSFISGMAKVYGPEGLGQIQAYYEGVIGNAEDQANAVEGAAPNLPDPTAGLGKDPAAEREAARALAKQKADDARREAQALAEAQLDVQAALHKGDDLALARIAKQRAQVALQFAETASERTAAYAQIIEADNQIREALYAVLEAQRDLIVARSHDDPVVAARYAVANARDAVSRAKGAQAQAEAQAALIRAQRDQRDAILALADAQTDILIAQAEAAGDTVRAAQLALDKIKRQLARTDLNTTERAQLMAEQVAAEAGVRDALLSEQRATIDYQLQIGQITKGQAIASLQALLQIPKLTEEQIREINLAIKDLRSQLGQDYQFNLPSQLDLPTTYEVRRLSQSGGTGSSYQDNRTISVTVNAETNASAEDIGAAVASAVGEPNRIGTYAGRY